MNNPGGYEVYLGDAPDAQTELLGFLGPTAGFDAGWVQFSFSFTATVTMAALGFIEFAPVRSGAGGAYPGLDLVSLEGRAGVPEPASIFLLSLGLLGIALHRNTTT